MRSAPVIRPAGAGGPADAAPPVEHARREPRAPRRRRPVDATVAPGPEASPRVDPRFSARRIAVQRSAGRRRLRRVAWFGVAVLLVAGAAGLTRTPLLDLDTIDVRGATATLGADQVRRVVTGAGLHPGTPLLGIDVGPAERALEALPSVAAAHITRHWPGSITVELTERVPVAAVALSTGTALVGADGIVVAVQPGASDLVAIEGPHALAVGDQLDEPALLAVAAALPDAVRPAITGIASSSDGVDLRLAADNAVVQLGSTDELAAKLAAVATMLRQADTTCMAVLDVKVPSAPTITRRPSC